MSEQMDLTSEEGWRHENRKPKNLKLAEGLIKLYQAAKQREVREMDDIEANSGEQ